MEALNLILGGQEAPRTHSFQSELPFFALPFAALVFILLFVCLLSRLLFLNENHYEDSDSDTDPDAVVEILVDRPDSPPPVMMRDEEALKEIPEVAYSRRASSAEACAICLADLEEGDAVRSMPRCMHTYHAACIEPWLFVFSYICPLCRNPIF